MLKHRGKGQVLTKDGNKTIRWESYVQKDAAGKENKAFCEFSLSLGQKGQSLQERDIAEEKQREIVKEGE